MPRRRSTQSSYVPLVGAYASAVSDVQGRHSRSGRALEDRLTDAVRGTPTVVLDTPAAWDALITDPQNTHPEARTFWVTAAALAESRWTGREATGHRHLPDFALVERAVDGFACVLIELKRGQRMDGVRRAGIAAVLTAYQRALTGGGVAIGPPPVMTKAAAVLCLFGATQRSLARRRSSDPNDGVVLWTGAQLCAAAGIEMAQVVEVPTAKDVRGNADAFARAVIRANPERAAAILAEEHSDDWEDRLHRDWVAPTP